MGPHAGKIDVVDIGFAQMRIDGRWETMLGDKRG